MISDANHDVTRRKIQRSLALASGYDICCSQKSFIFLIVPAAA